MVYPSIYLLKPGTSSLAGGVEAGSWVTLPSEVTYFKIECQSWGRSPQIDNGRKTGPLQMSIGLPQKKVINTYAFNNLFLGNAIDDAATAKRIKWLQYAKVEWPKLSSKVSVIYFHNGTSEVTTFHLYKSGFVNCKCLIEAAEEQYDNIYNCTISKFGVTETWT